MGGNSSTTVAFRRHLRRAVLPAVAAAALVLALPLRAQDSSSLRTRRAESGIDELDEVTREAIERGVEWLASKQQKGSGSWKSDPMRYQMSVTALCGLALLAHGDTPETGKHSEQVAAAVKWVLDWQVRIPGDAGRKLDGLFFDRPIRSAADFDETEDKAMHGHGYALLFMAEAYGQTRNTALRERMHAAIAAGCRLTERTISGAGGWFYLPGDNRDEASVTVTQIQALRAAQNAGFDVDHNVVRRAVAYVKDSQDESGGIRYMKGGGDPSAALTAAGMTVLYGSGEYGGDSIERGFRYLRGHLKLRKGEDRWFPYTQLYAAQAMFQRGGPEWASYFPRIRRELLDLRDPTDEAHWEGDFGPEFNTAIYLLILQLPLRYLPIFQR